MLNCKHFLSFVALTGAVSLAGCSGFSGASFPDATVNPAQTPIGALSGNNYGGHAPLAGAHIYLVEPGNTGYGSAVKSLITSTGSNVTANGSWTNSTYATDQFVPSGIYGIQAAADSSYTLTGDYTCDVGRPVWVIGYGGSPTYPQNNPAFAINAESVTGNGTTGVFTFTTTTTQNFYIGETVTISGFTGLNTGYNLGTVTVADPGAVSGATLSTSQFSVQTAYTGGSGSGGTAAGTVTAAPVFNPAAVNVASLGVCPSNGTLAGSISYIYMNEVSTTAWAYAFNQFANWSVTDQSGNNEFNVGATGTTQGQQALVNAAYAAANLYDIQGSSLTTSYAGEGHIARTTTPNGGFGTVPQATLDTLGNILAACVDSNNTYRLQAGLVSPQCNTLETYATDNGVYDTTTTIQSTTASHVAFNIAQAAMNIAHYPQGNGTGTTNTSGVQTITSAGTATTAANFVTALYTLPTGNVPFTPNLASSGSGKPNDFSVPILWNVGAANSDVEIDSLGNAWVAAATSGLYEITPQGALSNIAGSANNLSSALSAGLAIDSLNQIWASGTTGAYVYAPKVGVNGIDGTGNATQSAGIAVDNLAQSSGGPYEYIASGDDGNNTNTYTPQIVKQLSQGGVNAGGNFPIVGTEGTTGSAANCAYAVGFITLDSANNIWTASSQNVFAFQQPYVCRFDNNGNLQYSYQLPNGVSGQAGNFAFPRGLAVDAGDNIWFNDKNLDAVYKIAKGTTTSNSGATTTTVHNQLDAPSWLAVDGNNTIWVSNSGDAGATTGGKHATGLVQFNDAGTVLTPAYITGATLSTTPTTCLNSVAIDPSGNVWSSQGTGQATCTTATQVNEYIGLAAPTRTPISVAKGATAVGTKP